MARTTVSTNELVLARAGSKVISKYDLEEIARTHGDNVSVLETLVNNDGPNVSSNMLIIVGEAAKNNMKVAERFMNPASKEDNAILDRLSQIQATVTSRLKKLNEARNAGTPGIRK